MSGPSLAEQLRAAPLFSALEPSALDALASAAALRELADGESLCVEGHAGAFVFVVVRGSLDARKEAPGGVAVRLRTLGPGEVGGLTSSLTGGARSATLRAAGATAVLTVAKEALLGAMERHPSLARAVLGHLAAKVRGKTQALARLLADTTESELPRVAVFDAKPYDRRSFDEACAGRLAPRYFEPHLGPDTAALAAGFRVVCAFVNDDLGRATVERLAAQGVELLAMRCAGYNNVDLEAAARHDLTVVRVPAYSPHGVAEHAVALILTLNRKTHRAYNRVREGNFRLSGLEGVNLHGRTAGVVGLGKIGKCLADILRGFGMTVLAYDAYPDLEYAQRSGVRYASLDEVLSSSDIVSLHAPLTPQTYHLIDAARIARMKPGVMLVNTSRGGLVDARALIDGLKSGHIGAAGLDVYEEESDYFFEDRSDRVITDDLLARLMSFNNVLVTSHQAFLTQEALANIADTTVANIADFLAGKRGSDLVNVVVTQPGTSR